MHLCKNLTNSRCNAMAMKYEFELELMAANKNRIYLPTNPNTYPELLEYLCTTQCVVLLQKSRMTIPILNVQRASVTVAKANDRPEL